MKTPDKEDIIKIRLRRARKSLLEAKAMYENGFNNAALNRLYYACFYSATALLFKKDILTKTHAGVKQMLGLHYINPGILSEEMGEFYSNILYSRQNADYDDIEESETELVKEYTMLAKQFIDTVQNILEL
jgi:uncharacterized protein (UPF0332 family)